MEVNASWWQRQTLQYRTALRTVVGWLAERASDRKLRLLGLAFWQGDSGDRWDNERVRNGVSLVERLLVHPHDDDEIRILRNWLKGQISAVRGKLGGEAFRVRSTGSVVLGLLQVPMKLGIEEMLRWTSGPSVQGGHPWNADVILDIFGNPFRPISFSPEWRTTTAVAIAQGMYESREFGPMPLLADALQDAGCEAPEILDHCRGPGPHVRGCWVVDGVLGKS